jgi:hypothetical protein
VHIPQEEHVNSQDDEWMMNWKGYGNEGDILAICLEGLRKPVEDFI